MDLKVFGCKQGCDTPVRNELFIGTKYGEATPHRHAEYATTLEKFPEVWLIY